MTERGRTRRRTALAVVALLAVVAVFAIRLVDIQVVRAAELESQAQDRRSIPETLYGTRGEIVDANGTVLAYSVTRYDAKVAPSTMLGDDGELSAGTLELVTEFAGITGQEPQAVVDAIMADPDSNFAYVARGLDVATFRAVRELGLPTIAFERDQERVYPNGGVAGTLVGRLGTDGAQAGVEYMDDSCLASEDGELRYERSEDFVELPGSAVVTQEPVDGGTVQLTIDTDLQYAAEQAIAQQAIATGSDWATAVVVEVETGKIRAAADYPTYDPNDVDATAVQRPDGTIDLQSGVFARSYEPGSTFKAISIAAAIEQGVVSPTTQLTVGSQYVTPAGDRIGDSWSHGDLQFTTTGILANSSNIGVSQIMDMYGNSTAALQQKRDYYAAFGVGQQTAVDFNGEASGYLPATQDWNATSRYTIPFGQGVSTTSAEVASIYQTFGNGGEHLPLTLVESCTAPDGTVTYDNTGRAGNQAVQTSTAETIVSMLEKTVTDGSLAGRVDVPGYRVAAKSGTAEVAGDGGYTADRIVSVAGLAPAEDPKYAVVVTLGLPDTMKTSAAAAPTFAEIMSQTLTTYRVAPSTTQAADIPLTW